MDLTKLHYSTSHEWVSLTGDVATIGITDFAVNLLSDLVFIDLPKTGRRVDRGESCGEVESVKSVSDLYAPVSGEVVEVNAKLPDNLDWLKHDPYGTGWIAKLRVTGPAALEGLLDRAGYLAHCESESH